MRNVTGEQIAQVDNPDPFASPVWRSPVYRTPEGVIWLVQLLRLLWRVTWFLITHPLLDAVAGVVILTWLNLRWPGLVGLAVLVVAALIGLRVLRPDWFTRFVANPSRDKWRRWFYRRHWHSAMTLAGLAPTYRGKVMLPVLGRVRVTGAVDLVTVTLVTGQAPGNFADRAENLAHAFKVRLCRVRTAAPGMVTLELVRADTLSQPISALPMRAEVNLSALPVGRCENGSPWLLRLLSTHVLIAGATGSGKGSVIWSLIRALLTAIIGGWVRVWALDPKRMELSYGRAIFDRYADTPAAMVGLLESAVAEMHERAAQFGGKTRTFTPSTDFPFLVVLIDELAFLTAYQPERDLRKRAEAAIATLTSQGRSVGVCVVGALQDPRKDVISLRNLFPTRIALRLDESEQVDMVLGDGARDRGALADEISPLPQIGAGVGYVRLETSPDPVRVRAAFVSDEDIHAMVAAVTPVLVTAGGDAR
ncbi:MAG TPA: FtsK/SpoIIIE domain-containing protein [Streptosporangiaceae bacterium]|nr:FtsK/SpoIIIE domain-containing protein [Streptosporangiaceae bacterium]